MENLASSQLVLTKLKMIAYIIRRLLLVPILLLGLSLLIFTMLQFLSPYQRLTAFIDNPAKLSIDQMEEMIEQYGLRDPVYKQYYRWLNNILHGNLGWSEVARRPVMEAYFRYFPATVELFLWSIIPCIFTGIWLGIKSAVHHNKFMDHLIRVFTLIGWSLPTFIAGLIFLMIFYGWLGWFPSGRLSFSISQIVSAPEFVRYTGMNTIDALLNSNMKVFLDALRRLVLPVMTLSYIQLAFILRITRSSMLETLRKEYITTARAKGLKEHVVINKHARKNALTSVITAGGIMAMWLLGGSAVTETIFNYQGIGLWTVQAAQQIDVAAILGIALLNGTLIIIINLVVDILYAYVDPRVRI
jgi:peptide/nickel transport system permease protein